MSCSYDSDCYGSKKCCSNGLCGSDCSHSSGGTGGGIVAIIVVLCVCLVIGLVAFLVCLWYRRYKRVSHRGIVLRQGSFDKEVPTAPTAWPETVIVTTTTTSHGYTGLSGEDYTAQHEYINSSPPGTTLNQGDVNVNPANNSPPPYTEEIHS